ncbi:MAG: hypothetical protein Kapaf2KO_01120 [Candidatus Kapaibacteriales bacterium]
MENIKSITFYNYSNISDYENNPTSYNNKNAYFYNKVGDITKYEYSYSNEISETVIYEYDSKGIVNETVYDSEYNINYKSKYEYQENNKTIQYIYNTNDELIKTINYKYDKAGNLIEESQIYDDGSILAMKEYIYNDDGHVGEERVYGTNRKLLEINEYQYNDGNMTIKKTTEVANDFGILESLDLGVEMQDISSNSINKY